jgi:hypothetical protein
VVLATPFAQIKPEKQVWLWEGLVPFQVGTLFAGPGGVGKSSLLAWVVARATRGELPGDRFGKPITVALIAAEDDPAAVLWPRLTAAGADIERIVIITARNVKTDSAGALVGDYSDSVETAPQVNSQLEEIREKIREFGVELLIVDPITSVQRDEDRRTDQVRDSLESLTVLARKENLATIWVTHTTKATGAGVTVRGAIAGSHEYQNVARSVLAVAEDPDTGNRIVSQVKTNYGPPADSLAFTLETVSVPIGNGDEIDVGLATYVGVSEVSVGEIITRAPESPAEGTKKEILDLLADGREWSPSQVAQELEVENVNTVTQTMRRLAKKAGQLECVSRGVYKRQSDKPPALSAVTLSLSHIDESLKVTSDNLTSTPGVTFDTCAVHNWPTSHGECAQCAGTRQGVSVA